MGRAKRPGRLRKRESDLLDAGLCTCCGKEPLASKYRCLLCHRRAIESQRERTGYRPWRPGGRGRPPFVEALAAARARPKVKK